MTDRSHGIAVIFGWLMVAASLVFVASQVRQDRRMARAELNTAQLEFYAARHAAGLESGAYLGLWSAPYGAGSWDTEALPELEVAAAELDALLWWNYAEVTFEQRWEGLVSAAAWREFETEVRFGANLPAHAAVFDIWFAKIPSEFTRTGDETRKTQ